jgi:O-antigen ligase
VGPVQLTLARLLIVVGLAALVYTEGVRGGLFRSRLELPLLLLLAAALVTTLKWDTGARFRFLVESIALFYLAFGLFRSRPETRIPLAIVGLIAVALSSLGGLAQVAQHVATGFYRSGCSPVEAAPPHVPAGSITRATGTFLNPNLLAAHILLLAPLGALAIARSTRKIELRLALGLVVALSYLALVFTFSRTAIFVALIGLGVALVTSKLRNRVWLAGVGVVLAAGSLFLFAACGAEGGVSGYGRGHEWSETIHVIEDHPVYGVGLGRIGDVLKQRDSRASANHAHNLFLNWWAEAGPGALLAWLWILIALIAWTTRSAIRGDPVARAMLVALIGFFGYSMTDHPANVNRIATAFWIVAALAAAVAPAVPSLRERFRRLRTGGIRLRRRRPAVEPEATG